MDMTKSAFKQVLSTTRENYNTYLTKLAPQNKTCCGCGEKATARVTRDYILYGCDGRQVRTSSTHHYVCKLGDFCEEEAKHWFSEQDHEAECEANGRERWCMCDFYETECHHREYHEFRYISFK